ncbi:NADH-quinone oxidoreductase subunit C [Paenibacillus sp. J5C_2022]|uniref:NADH-quinone oxidoreductase subunit C n=1 Tax=Paenibacillus sp. J5C2022 TaxID=2977129 RepID=UPI0021CFA1F7|nr:NADH-quinone oxidoreductase subunit C [Paenibacillus sp. J5C2022]MCU6708495.1 NADH-quinone oxidoreductase subunit C [Paenibacillus sp. J5C2022]
MSEDQNKAQVGSAASDEEREAKRKAAAEARAARAAAKAAASEAQEPEPKPPSPRQGELDGIVALLKREIGEEAIVEASINELNGDMPMVEVRSEYWLEAARLLKGHGDMNYRYLRNVSGVDYESHLEVVYCLLSLDSGRDCAVKVKTDRTAPSIPSITPLWSAANWNEREIFDLLGIDFPGHPDLRRIMMPDDWDGHPLRKDYIPLDPEV